jgi:NAD(P)H dehydrogenase (quinone)
VLASADGHAGRRLELAGSMSFSMDEFAALIGRLAGRTIACRKLAKADYEALLVKAGLPDFVAAILGNSDASAADGWLFDDSRTLEKLIGRPTTPVAAIVEAAVKAAG